MKYLLKYIRKQREQANLSLLEPPQPEEQLALPFNEQSYLALQKSVSTLLVQLTDLAGELQQKSQILKTITDNIDEIFFIYDKQFEQIKYISKNINGLVCDPLPADDPLAPVSGILHPEDRALFKAFIRNGRNAKFVVRANTRLNKISWLEMQLIHIAGDVSNDSDLIIIAKDVTKDILAHRKETSLIALAEQSSQLKVIVNQNGEIRFANAAFLNFYGLDNTADVSALRITKIFPDEVLHAIENLQHNKLARKIEIESTLKRHSGEIVYTNNYIFKIENEYRHNPYIAVITSDITRIKEQEHKLFEALQKATQATEAKSRFLALISHELRTPLNAIMGMSEIGLKYHENEKTANCFRDIAVSSNHLLHIINNILDMAKVESGKFILVKDVIDMHRLVQDVNTIIKVKTQQKQQRLRLNYEKVSEQYYIGDMQRLKQIIINLLSNASKFTPREGIIELNIEEITRNGASAMLEFKISDTGIGMPPEKLHLLFKPFEQLDAPNTRNYEGTGLGLMLSKKFVELMGGAIKVESQLGKGSIFTFRVPFEVLGKTLQSFIGKKTEEIALLPSPKPLYLDQFRILIVDDVEINRMILEEMLSDTGAEIESAESGMEALRLFEEKPAHHYGLIFMDIQMPEMDGYETTRRIRTSYKPDAATIPICALSANAFAENMQQAKASGMTGFITKPVNSVQLIETIRNIREQRKT